MADEKTLAEIEVELIEQVIASLESGQPISTAFGMDRSDAINLYYELLREARARAAADSFGDIIEGLALAIFNGATAAIASNTWERWAQPGTQRGKFPPDTQEDWRRGAAAAARYIADLHELKEARDG